MAYGLKYQYSFKDFKSTSTFRIDILQLNYSGSTTTVNEGKEVSIKKRGSKDKQDTVIEGSELTFSLLAIKGVREFNDVIESNYRDFKVALYKDSVLYWVGYLKPENLDKDFFDNKYFVNFSASDGLADLKDINYIPNTVAPKIPVLQLVKECLTNLGIPLDFKVQLNTYETNLSTATNCTLLETFVNSKRFQKVKSGRIVNTDCYKVIEDALTIFNVKLKQSEGKYYIVNNLEYDSFIYDIDFATLTQNSRTASNLTVNIDTFKFDKSSTLERIRPLKTVNTTFLNRNDGESSLADWQNGWTVTDGNFTIESSPNSLRVYSPTADEDLDGQKISTGEYIGTIESAPFNLEYFDNEDTVIIKFNVSELIVPYGNVQPIQPYIPNLRVRVGLKKPDGTITFKEGNFLDAITGIGEEALIAFQDSYSFYETGSYSIVIDVPAEQYNFVPEFDFTINDLEVIGAVGEEGVTAITFDKFYRATSDLNNIDNVDYTLKFGDSIQYADIGALKIGDVNTNVWSRYNSTDNLSIQEIFTFQKLINKGYYKNYLRLKIYDFDLAIENHNVILLDGKVYQILNFSRNFISSITEVAMVEILTTDVPYTINQILLSSIDGDDTKSYSKSVNVTNTSAPYELPTAKADVLGGIKIGTGLSADVSGLTSVNYGTTLGTSAEGNDSRILNGETAFNKKVNSVTVTGDATKIVTLALQDGTTLTSSFTDIANEANGDEYVNSLNWASATGVLTVGRTGGLTDITVNLDGRYLTNSSLNNYVTTDTTQTITGLKTFSSTILGRSDSSQWVIKAQNGTGIYNLSTTESSLVIRAGSTIDSIIRSDSNSSYIHVASAGNFGIGTSSPTEKLHVSGSILSTGSFKLTNDTSRFLEFDGINHYIGYVTSETNIRYRSSGEHRFYSGGFNERLVIDSVGNVGIGTTSPSAKLDVAGNINLSESLTFNGTASKIYKSGSNSRIYVDSDGQSVVAQFASYGMYLPKTGHSYNLYLAGSMKMGHSEHAKLDINSTVRIKSNGNSYLNGGNVGIGTSSPSEKLHVNGHIAISTTNGYFRWIGDNVNGDDRVRLRSESGIVKDIMTYVETGNVGINTNTPFSPLTVVGRATTSELGNGINLIKSVGSGISAMLSNNSTDDAFLELYNSTLNDRVRIDSNGDSFFRGGNVGINTNTPSYKLDVNGSAKFNFVTNNYYSDNNGNPRLYFGANSSAYAFIFRAGNTNQITQFRTNLNSTTVTINHDVGSITADGNITSNSDIRLKENINSLSSEETLTKLLTLTAKRYNLKADKTKTTNIGYIAQEIEKVFPEYVHYSKDGIRSVDYSKMVAVMGEAIKELNNKIDKLENKIK